MRNMRKMNERELRRLTLGIFLVMGIIMYFVNYDFDVIGFFQASFLGIMLWFLAPEMEKMLDQYVFFSKEGEDSFRMERWVFYICTGLMYVFIFLGT